MGYRRDKTYLLEFADGDMAGLEVRCKYVSVGTLFDVAEVIEGDVRDRAVIKKAIGDFANVIVSWNYEDDHGDPVPTTLESLLAQDSGFMLSLIRAWSRALAGVSVPLELPSVDGDMEDRLPVVALQ